MNGQTLRFVAFAVLILASPLARAQEPTPAERAYDQRVRQLKQDIPDRPALRAVALQLNLNSLTRESADPNGAFFTGSIKSNDEGKILALRFLHLVDLEIQIRPDRMGNGFTANVTKQGAQYSNLRTSVKRIEANNLYLRLESDSAILSDPSHSVSQPTIVDLFFDFANSDFKSYVKFLSPGQTGEFLYVGRIR